MMLMRGFAYPAKLKLTFCRKQTQLKTGIVNAISGRLILGLLIALAIAGQAQAEPVSDAVVKTAFLYNFFKFIDWPETIAQQDYYSLCTTNNDQLGDSLLVLENKTIHGKPIVTHRGIKDNDLKKCHMIFIGSSENAEAIVRDLEGLPVVTVSDTLNFIDQGGMIGLIPSDDRLGFEVNLDVINAGGIHIGAQLLKLAKRVNKLK
ncbi:MAG: YfiR family protein [Methylobacter sp.]|nr:YfiR family protein [Methylobacter sp.]